MGLAASQARLLTITSRKASCESDSMSIAQQKLSITRELATATSDYSNALDATCLVWDTSNCSSDVDTATTYDFSYDAMYTPSALNGYEPYVLTDRYGSVILNDKMLTAAETAGIASNGSTTPTATGYADFIEALGVQNYISYTQVDTLTSEIRADEAAGTYDDSNVYDFYDSDVGIGGEPIDKSSATVVNLTTLISNVKSNSSDSAASEDPSYYNAVNFDFSTLTYYPTEDSSNTNTGALDYGNLYVDDSKKDDDTIISLTDFFIDDICYVSENNTDQEDALMEVTAIVKAMITSLETIFAEDAQSSAAFEYAEYQIEQLLNSDAYSYSSSTSTNISDKADDYNGWVDADSGIWAINLSNVMKSFLTYYAQAASSFDSTYTATGLSSESNYVTDDPDYYYVLTNEDAVDEQDLLVADFYSSLYNNICTKGYTSANGDIDDPDYLASAIQSAQIFITTMYDDYNYYQIAYTQADCVVEVEDTEAIARAELEYLQIQAELDYKEEELDLELQTIDLELSSLNTELETVKSLVTSSVERAFTMFSSG